MISRLAPPDPGMTQRIPHRQARPTLPSWRPVVAVLCGLFALAGLLSAPVAGAALYAADGACLLTPDPGTPEIPADGELQAKKPRRTALPATQRTEKQAPSATFVAVSPALPEAPVPAIAGSFVPHATTPAYALPPARSSRSRGPPAAA